MAGYSVVIALEDGGGQNQMRIECRRFSEHPQADNSKPELHYISICLVTKMEVSYSLEFSRGIELLYSR